NTLSMRANIQSRHNFSGWVSNGNGHGSQTMLQFLVDDGVSVALNDPENLPKFFRTDYGSFRVTLKLHLGNQFIERLGWQICQQDAPHRSTKCGQPTPYAEINGHDARYVGTRDVNNFRTIKRSDRARLVQNMADMLENRLGCYGERRRRKFTITRASR